MVANDFMYNQLLVFSINSSSLPVLIFEQLGGQDNTVDMKINPSSLLVNSNKSISGPDIYTAKPEGKQIFVARLFSPFNISVSDTRSLSDKYDFMVAISGQTFMGSIEQENLKSQITGAFNKFLV